MKSLILLLALFIGCAPSRGITLSTALFTWRSGYVESWPDPNPPGSPRWTEVYWSPVFYPDLNCWQFVGCFTNQNACVVPWSASNNFICVREAWPAP